MTEDVQLPFDAPSNDQHTRPMAETARTPCAPGATPAVGHRADQADKLADAAPHGLTEPAVKQREEASRAEEHLPPQDSSLFEPGSVKKRTASVAKQPPVRGPDHDVVPAETLFFLTNRMNLNGVLSSRVVAPRESFQKYYTDLLEECPGWVPLLPAAPSSTQVRKVTSERGAGAPVIVEFPLEVAGRRKSDEAIVFVPAVALSKAIAIHLPSERDLKEHRARGYSNVYPHDELLRVTPELFGSEAVYPHPFIPPEAAAVVDWRRIDRIRGAVNAAVRAASSGEQLVLVAALVGATRLPAAVAVPPWFTWSNIDDHAGPGPGPGPGPHPESAMPDHVGFRAAYEVLGEQDVTEAWRPNAVLDSVETRVCQAGLRNDASNAIVQNLERVRSIVDVEVDFEPFRPSSRALVSAKALLLVLLRQELDQLLAWSAEETGADDATRMVAAVLAGRLRGLSRESTEFRSLELDDLTAAWAVRVAWGGAPSLGKVQFVTNSRATSLKINGVEVATQNVLLPDLLSKYQKIPEAKKEATRIKVSRAMGWPVEHRIVVPKGASVETGDTFITISNSEAIVMEVAVDELGFFRRLGSLTGAERRRAAEAFVARR